MVKWHINIKKSALLGYVNKKTPQWKTTFKFILIINKWISYIKFN